MKVLLIVYDNGSYANFFPQGIAYITSYLEKIADVTIYNQDIYHYDESHLTQILNDYEFDVIGIGVIGGYYQYKKLLKICSAIKLSKSKAKIILGGHGPDPEPEYFLKVTGADFIVHGEGEFTFKSLVESIQNNTKLDQVKNISYFDNEKFISNKINDPITDVDSIFIPAYHRFDINHYAMFREPGFSSVDRVIPILSGRGCPYNCNFCFRQVKGFRPRSVKSIIDEIQFLKNRYYINGIDFSDELLMSSESRTINICESFLSENLNIKWSCNGRLNFASDKVLRLMKRAGCVFVNYGIESLDDKMLEIMGKHLTVEKIIKGIENTLKNDIIPGLNIIFGNIGETKEILQRGVDFLKKYNNIGQFRTIRPVTPYPGSPLYYYAIENGLLNNVKEFYEEKHINSDLLSVNFTNMTDDDFYNVLKQANLELIEDYYEKNKFICKKQAMDLYNNLNVNFRGFRQI